MQAPGDLTIEQDAAGSRRFDFEEIFQSDYAPVTRLITRVIRDPGRAEELAVEAFWRLWKTSSAHGESAGAWVRRTAVRLAIDELRQRARRTPRVECAAILLDAGANISSRDTDYLSTPLAWAAGLNLPDMVEFLLSRGAPTNLPDDEPWATPLAWARRGHTQIVERLKASGASR